jgi:hypothetical protein
MGVDDNFYFMLPHPSSAIKPQQQQMAEAACFILPQQRQQTTMT